MKFELPVKPLARFEGAVTEQAQTGILFSLNDYLELVDYTGRVIKPGKRGAIPEHLPNILRRLEMDLPTWLESATQFEKNYRARFFQLRRQRRSS